MITSVTSNESKTLLEAYMSVQPKTDTQPIVEREDDDMEAISKYKNVRTVNIYVKPPDGAIAQAFQATVDPMKINVSNGTTTLIATDMKKDIDIQIVIDQDGKTSIVPTGDRDEHVDGPWFEQDPMFWDRGDESELNLMIIQEV